PSPESRHSSHITQGKPSNAGTFSFGDLRLYVGFELLMLGNA
ncbi:unnamed protein product, partial [Allacma fusca]